VKAAFDNITMGGHRWSSDEEELLVKLVENKTDWKEIGSYFPRRTAKSCQLHYYSKYIVGQVDKKVKENYAKVYERYVEIISYSQITELMIVV
jgi:hypothetical protein